MMRLKGELDWILGGLVMSPCHITGIISGSLFTSWPVEMTKARMPPPPPLLLPELLTEDNDQSHYLLQGTGAVHC